MLWRDFGGGVVGVLMTRAAAHKFSADEVHDLLVHGHAKCLGAVLLVHIIELHTLAGIAAGRETIRRKVIGIVNRPGVRLLVPCSSGDEHVTVFIVHGLTAAKVAHPRALDLALIRRVTGVFAIASLLDSKRPILVRVFFSTFLLEVAGNTLLVVVAIVHAVRHVGKRIEVVVRTMNNRACRLSLRRVVRPRSASECCGAHASNRQCAEKQTSPHRHRATCTQLTHPAPSPSPSYPISCHSAPVRLFRPRCESRVIFYASPVRHRIRCHRNRCP